MSDAIKEEIEQAATEPATHSVDGQTTANRPLADLIAADKHLAAREAAAQQNFGLQFFKMNPPGSV